MGCDRHRWSMTGAATDIGGTSQRVPRILNWDTQVRPSESCPSENNCTILNACV